MMFNTFAVAPPSNLSQPPPYDPTSDHLQRCMDSVKELAKTISCAMDQWHGHGLLGCADIHGSFARISANLEQLPADVECIRCTRRTYKSNLHSSPGRASLPSTCTCDLDPEPAKRRRTSGTPQKIAVADQNAFCGIDSDIVMSPSVSPWSDRQTSTDEPPTRRASCVLSDGDLDLDMGLDLPAPAAADLPTPAKQDTSPSDPEAHVPIVATSREQKYEMAGTREPRGANPRQHPRQKNSHLNPEVWDRYPKNHKMGARNTPQYGSVDQSLTQPRTPSKPQVCDDGTDVDMTRDDLVLDQHIESHDEPFKVPDTVPSLHHCLFKPCSYASKRESNCKLHMEKAHNWTYVRSQNSTRLPEGSDPAPLSSAMSTPQTPIAPPATSVFAPRDYWEASPMTPDPFGNAAAGALGTEDITHTKSWRRSSKSRGRSRSRSGSRNGSLERETAEIEAVQKEEEKREEAYQANRNAEKEANAKKKKTMEADTELKRQ